MLPGYFQGKRRAEEALAVKFPGSGVALRPGFIYGTRQVGGLGIPLGAIGALERLLSFAFIHASVDDLYKATLWICQTSMSPDDCVGTHIASPFGTQHMEMGLDHLNESLSTLIVPVGLRPPLMMLAQYAAGYPLDKVLGVLPAKSLAGVPVLGLGFVPPISASAVGRAAVAAATDPSIPAGILDIWQMKSYEA